MIWKVIKAEANSAADLAEADLVRVGQEAVLEPECRAERAVLAYREWEVAVQSRRLLHWP